MTLQDFSGIDFGTGKLQAVSGDVLHVEYPSGFRLVVRSYKYLPYYVIFSKEDVLLLTVRCHSGTEVLSYVRNLNRDILAGKYKNKKTLREQVRQIVQERNLTSYMNTSKWEKFLEIVRTLPFPPPYVYKTVFDDPNRSDVQPFRTILRRPDCYDRESFPYQFYQIEYVRILPKYAVNLGGHLIEKLEIHDETEELCTALQNAHIPFETEQQEIVIYGYR